MADVPKNDLPDRFGPMLVKEMRQNMRRGSFIVPFIAVHLLAVLAMVMEFQTGAQDRFSELPWMLNLSMVLTNGPLWIVITVVCGVIMPLGGLVLMGQELEEGNHELLLLTRLSRWKVVRGKFISLWSLSVLTLFSLLPYVLCRYQIGGVELIRELGCTLTVLAVSAILTAGAIGASSFRGLGGRIMTMLLFSLWSAASSIAAVMGGLAGRQSGGSSESVIAVMWHLNALAAVFCFVVLGLALARSRMRLVVHAYEVKPSFMVMGLLVFTPFVVGMVTAMTGLYAGFVGLLGMGLVAVFADVTPKAPAWVKTPQANVPGGVAGGQ